MRRTLIGIAVAVLMIAATGIVLAQEARPPANEPPQLTAEQQTVLKQAQDLRKEIQINRLETRLAELKGASQDELAKKATEGYELRGKLQALWMKNPEVARERGRRGTGRGMGPGAGMGRGMGHRRGRAAGPGMGQGFGRGQGMGPACGMGPNCPMGPGMGQGRRGRGAGQGMGPGMGQGRHGRGMGQGMGRGGRGTGQGFGRMNGQGFGPWTNGQAPPPANPAPEPAPAS